MKSGYKIIWTTQARNELSDKLEYLTKKWSDKEMKALALSVERNISLLTSNPFVFLKTNKKDVFKAIVMRKNSLYYLINESQQEIVILSFFNHKRKPKSF